MTPTIDKVVCYVIRDGHLLVFTHDDEPLTVTGVQVPAGTVRVNERLEDAAFRELHEETGLNARSGTYLGTQAYDLRPAKDEIARRHFFLLEVLDTPQMPSWRAGETDPSDGGSPVSWTCWWLPIKRSHILAAGLGAKMGAAAQLHASRR